jgi:hypothetical protein
MNPSRYTLKKVLLAPFIWLGAIIFLVEEILWDFTAAVMARIGTVRMVHAIENLIASLPPRWAIIAFLLPSSILIPAKLFGLHAIATGHWLLGSTIFIVAKMAGLALFSRIFNLTRPALMKINWFARFYAKVMHYRNLIHSYIERWSAYQHIKQHLTRLMTAFKAKCVTIFSVFKQ